MPEKPQVFVIDDNPLVRKSLALLLEAEDIGTAVYASAAEFLSHYQPEQPGCLLLDYAMPDMDGLELQKALVVKKACIPIIFLSGEADVPVSVQALKAGAVDFLQKPVGDTALLASVRHAIARDKRLRQVAEQKALLLARFGRLTTREWEVMALIVRGQSNKQAARTLKVSPRTIEGHRARVMDKMRADSLAELIDMARNCGMFEDAG